MSTEKSEPLSGSMRKRVMDSCPKSCEKDVFDHYSAIMSVVSRSERRSGYAFSVLDEPKPPSSDVRVLE
jgi:hypothetical protein